MPAVSSKQRIAMAIAEHEPNKLYAKNKGMLKMSKSQLHHFASTKGLTQHRKGTGGGGGSPVKFRKREGGLGDL